MRKLDTNEIQMVDGGGIGDAIVGWVVGKVLDATVNYVKNGEVNEDTFSSPVAGQNVYGA